jgi:hypothetical protein
MSCEKIEIVIDKMETNVSIVKQENMHHLEIPLYYILPVHVNNDDVICKDFDLLRANLAATKKRVKKMEIKPLKINTKHLRSGPQRTILGDVSCF